MASLAGQEVAFTLNLDKGEKNMEGKTRVRRRKVFVTADGNLEPVFEGCVYVGDTGNAREEMIRSLSKELEGIPSDDISVDFETEYSVYMPTEEVDFAVKIIE